jgi:hypothetical protein
LKRVAAIVMNGDSAGDAGLLRAIDAGHAFASPRMGEFLGCLSGIYGMTTLRCPIVRTTMAHRAMAHSQQLLEVACDAALRCSTLFANDHRTNHGNVTISLSGTLKGPPASRMWSGDIGVRIGKLWSCDDGTILI